MICLLDSVRYIHAIDVQDTLTTPMFGLTVENSELPVKYVHLTSARPGCISETNMRTFASVLYVPLCICGAFLFGVLE